jgi:hypothetical protein
VPEDELELVKIANDDETGFAVRYISQCARELTRWSEGRSRPPF